MKNDASPTDIIACRSSPYIYSSVCQPIPRDMIVLGLRFGSDCGKTDRVGLYYALAFLALIGPHRRFPPMWYHSRDTNSRRTVKSPRTPVSRPRSVNRPKSSSDGIRACMRLLLAACGLTGRHYMPVDHMCCLFPCKTPEKKIVHVFSLSALPRTASVPVDIQPSCLRIRPAPLLFGH